MTTDGRPLRPGGLPATTGELRDGGSATVWLLAVLFALLSLAGLVFTVTVIGAARQRAATAADLAALAAAALPPIDGEQAVCARAREISAANGTSLGDCRIVANAVEIAVSVRLPTVIGMLGDLSVHARAGPWGGAAGAYQPMPQEAHGQKRVPDPS